MTKRETDIVIIGGGPIGLYLGHPSSERRVILPYS